MQIFFVFSIFRTNLSNEIKHMKTISLLLLSVLLLSFAGCDKDKTSVRLIDQAEALLDTNPDSAYLLLDRIHMPEELSERQLARWCMLSGKAADKTSEGMPYVSQLKRAQTWFQKHGTPEEQAQISLFLGRSYVEDKEYDKAMNTYLQTLNIAVSAQAYNIAGYTYSYLADLYVFEDMSELAAEKYKEASRYFQKAGNQKSYAFALRDVGQMYTLMDSCEVALTYLQKADTLVTSLGDTLAMSYIYNGLGNVYEMLGQFDLGEEYHLKSIRLDNSDTAPNYLALATLFVNSGNLEKARFYLKQASIPTLNKYTPVGILYQSYLIAKKENNIAEALNYLESYQCVVDSVTMLQNEVDIAKAEKKYTRLRIQNENIQLKESRQYQLIIGIILLCICLFLLLIHQIQIKQKNRKIYEQQDTLSKKDIYLLNLSNTLQTKKKELEHLSCLLNKNRELLHIQDSLEEQEQIYQQKQEEVNNLNNELLQLRKEKLLSSTIVKKVIKLSQTVIPGANKSPLSGKDWEMLINKINEIYPSFSYNLESKIEGLTPVFLNLSCASLLELDTNQIANLLHITPYTVNRYRTNLRKKLGITGEKKDIHDYLIGL